ncbi:UNVERIFIED_CONTAM: hypothetical protein GTU68_036169 [Idotea baltica]|nr:hypothetical protein [Idotea baltica]
MKTNKTASKKFKANAAGKLKRGKAYRSHNTAKKTPKRMRQLRRDAYVDKHDIERIKALVPYI